MVTPGMVPALQHMLTTEHLRFDGLIQCRHLRWTVHTTVSLFWVVYAVAAYSNVHIYAVLRCLCCMLLTSVFLVSLARL